jgi:hypothetical protein
MMAGHPNEARPEGLRNLPFMIFMGGDDSAYNRNAVAKAWGERLDNLQQADPAGYEHQVTIYPGLGHWMEGRDASALPWMARHTRQPWPKRVVWLQDDVTANRFYWLQVDQSAVAKGVRIDAEIKDQAITLKSEQLCTVTLRLSDALLDLDQPITVSANGRQVFSGRVQRTRSAIEQSLRERSDPSTVATALLTVAGDQTIIRHLQQGSGRRPAGYVWLKHTSRPDACPTLRDETGLNVQTHYLSRLTLLGERREIYESMVDRLDRSLRRRGSSCGQ